MTSCPTSKRFTFSPFLAVDSDSCIEGFKFGSFLLADQWQLFTDYSDQIVISLEQRKAQYFEDILANSTLRQPFYGFFAERDGTVSIFRRDFGLQRAGYLLIDIRKEAAIIRYSEEYRRWAGLRLASLPSLGAILTDVAYVVGIGMRKLALHAAAVEKNGKGSLIIGLPDTGKTFTTSLLIESDYAFMSDDIVYVDCKNKRIASVPFTCTMDGKGLSLRLKRLKSYVWKNPSAGRGSLLAALQPRVSDHADLEHIFFIERGPKMTAQLDLSACVDRLLGSNGLEFRYCSNPLLGRYGYYFPRYFQGRLMEEERECVTAMVKGLDACYLVQRERPEEFAEFIATKVER